MRVLPASSAALLLLLAACLDRLDAPLPAPDKSVPVAEENLHSGFANWDAGLHARADVPTAGYVLPTSLRDGDTLHTFITSIGGRVRIQIFRLGWYAGLGARLMIERVEAAVFPQAECTPPSPGPSVCTWNETTRFIVPSAWLPGIYLAKFTDQDGGASFAPFVIRSRNPAPFLAILPFATYQAYNNWGGTSLYVGPGSDRAVAYANRAYKVSFARPYSVSPLAGHFLGVDYLTIRWLERNAYDVSYVTDLDLDAGIGVNGSAAAWLILGHSEYWTWNMWAQATDARDRGINLAFLGGNDIYWMARIEQVDVDEVLAPVVVCFRDASLDPDGEVPTRATVHFRDPPNNTPENSLVGVMSAPPNTMLRYPADLVVAASGANPLLASTGLHRGDRLPQVAGWEGDRIIDNGQTPPGIQVLFEIPFTPTGDTLTTATFQSTFYRWPSGAQVFAAGQPGFAWALSSYWHYTERPPIQRFLSNLLARFGATRESP